MAVTHLACTEDPAQSERRLDDFRVLFSKTRTIQRASAQHLRLTLGTDEGLDIAVLAHEMECCNWFRFTLTPTAQGTVELDIEVPADTGEVRGPAPEALGAGTPEEILDWFAHEATEVTGAICTTQATEAQQPAAPACGCCAE